MAYRPIRDENVCRVLENNKDPPGLLPTGLSVLDIAFLSLSRLNQDNRAPQAEQEWGTCHHD